MTGGDEGIGVNKSAPSRVVITALEVIEPCLSVIYVSTIAQRVILTQCGCVLQHRMSCPYRGPPKRSTIAVYSAIIFQFLMFAISISDYRSRYR